jgi:hypothetical protein
MEGHHGTAGANALDCLRDPLAPLRLCFTRGAAKVPLLPGLPTQRGWLDLGLAAGHILALAAFLLAPGLELGLLRAAVALLAANCVLDRAAYLGCLGFNHFPILLVLAWSEDPRFWLPGCQAVQVAQLFWAGLAKLGPWFHSGAIVSGMVGNSLLAPAPLRRAMFRDVPAGDLRPSRLAAALALFGTVTEVAAPVLAVWPGEGALPAQLRNYDSFNFPSSFYHQIFKTRPVRGRAARSSHYIFNFPSSF